MSYLGKTSLQAANIKRWTGTPGAVNVISFTTLGFKPLNEQATIITINGVKQHDSAFILTGSAIQFNATLLITDEVEVLAILNVGQPLVPADNSVQRKHLAPSFRNITQDKFSGNGSTTVYTLSYAPMSSSSILVFLNGVSQLAGSDFTVSSTALTFTTAPITGTDNINVIHLTYATGTTEVIPTDGSVTDPKIVSMNASKLTGALPAIDGSSLTGTVNGLEINTTATSNIGLGANAVDSITTGDHNVGVGDGALTSNTEGTENTASGGFSLYYNTTGSNNTASGYKSLYTNDTGHQNTASGYESLYLNTTGSGNTASGHKSLYTNDTGAWNTASGYESLYWNTTGGWNTASGYASLYWNTTGNGNTASGVHSLYLNTTASWNTAYGYESLYKNTGAWNTASGYLSLRENTTGAHNTAYGSYSLYNNDTGNGNTASGGYSLHSNDTGSTNTAYGYASLGANTTGSNNTALGYQAGDNITQGSSNIIIGSDVDAPSATASNQLNIGNWIKGVDGVVTMPNQPAFHAKVPTDVTDIDLTNDSYTVTYATPTLNTGNNLNSSTGVFTAPVSGVYLFTANTRIDDISLPYGNYCYLTLDVNGYTRSRDLSVTSGAHINRNVTAVVYMAANDSAYCYLRIGGAIADTNIDLHHESFFSGHLIG